MEVAENEIGLHQPSLQDLPLIDDIMGRIIDYLDEETMFRCVWHEAEKLIDKLFIFRFRWRFDHVISVLGLYLTF
jgi:hypothetical protein